MTLEDVATRFTQAPDQFDEMAAVVRVYQARHSPIYSRYCKYRLPLPVAAFKQEGVVTFPEAEAERVFVSSGTGGIPSRHPVKDLGVYEASVTTHFAQVFGDGPFTLVAHLPRYAKASSLVYMLEVLIQKFGDAHSGFFLKDHAVLHQAITHSWQAGTSLILFGAAFGLMDLVQDQSIPLPATALVIETGGMKTYRRGINRHTLHQILADGFGLSQDRIWSEYGMCELMSQCYTRGGAVFYPPAWMSFRVVDPEDPSRALPEGEPGALALFDLANLHAVSDLLTEDLAVERGKGFEVLGRLSQAELRGCNFLLDL